MNMRVSKHQFFQRNTSLQLSFEAGRWGRAEPVHVARVFGGLHISNVIMTICDTLMN
jgi:hypothetical protein